MGILVLVLLVAAWGLVLGPTLLRSTSNPSPMDTEKIFRKALGALSGSRKPRTPVSGRWVLVPPSSDYPVAQPQGAPRVQARRRGPSAAQRRRQNLTILAGFIVVTFLLGLLPPLRFLLWVNLVADILLIGYLAAAMYVASRPARKNAARAVRVVTPPDVVRPPEAAGGHL